MTAPIFLLELVPVEILTQLLFLLQMVILWCKHSDFNLCFLPLPRSTCLLFSAFSTLAWSNFSRTLQLHTQNTSTLLTQSKSLLYLRGLIQLERLPQSAGTGAVIHQTSLPYSHLPLSFSSAATFQQHRNRHICWSLYYTPDSASWCTEVHHNYTSASQRPSGVRHVYWDIYRALHIECYVKINQENSKCWITEVWHYTNGYCTSCFHTCSQKQSQWG